MNQPLIECVPNFSEGRNLDTLDEIAKAITGIHGVHLLHIDRGEGANRTVFTFAGPPEAVVEAAFCAVRVAGELIDMRQHHGAHPRIGATDVLPLVPISGISLKECAELARQLARRISDWVVCVKDGDITMQGSPEQVFVPEVIDALYDLEPGVYDATTGSVELPANRR